MVNAALMPLLKREAIASLLEAGERHLRILQATINNVTLNILSEELANASLANFKNIIMAM